MEAHDLQLVGEAILDSLAFSAGGVTVSLFDDDSTLTANSNTRVATQAAVKSYVDAAVPGTGNLIFQLNSKVEVTDTGTDGKVVMDADGTEVLNVTANAQRLGTSGDTNVYVDQSADSVNVMLNSVLTMTVTEGQVTINGNLAVDGTTFTVNDQEVTTSDNIIVLNNGEAGAGVTSGVAGIQIDRGSLTDYQILFDESSDTFVIGEIGTLQAVATRQDSPITNGIAYWNSTSNRFDTTTSGTLTAAGGLTAAQLIWESGVNRISSNDGGGNVQIRMGNEYDSGEVFTHAGTAFYIGGNLDSASGYMDLKVASNGGAGIGSAVAWGGVLRIQDTALSWSGSSLTPVNGSGTITLGSAPSGTTALEYNGHFYATKVYNSVWG